MPHSTFPFLLLPPEVRDLCYGFAFQDYSINVCDPKLHRSIGSSLRPKNRCLPALTQVSSKVRDEAMSVLAMQCTLVFNDYFNFVHLVNLVPESFARHVRRISLKGDIVPGSLFSKFPSLRHVSYQQLGNCFYPPLRENGFNKQAMKARQAELVELVLGRSPSLNLLSNILCDPTRQGGPVTLIAEANVLSCHERVNLFIDVNNEEIICRRLMGVHRLYDTVGDEKP